MDCDTRMGAILNAKMTSHTFITGVNKNKKVMAGFLATAWFTIIIAAVLAYFEFYLWIQKLYERLPV
jgi:hypothetical protein